MITTFIITAFAFLSIARFQSKMYASFNLSQVLLISLSFASMSIYLNVANGKIFVWHATDEIGEAILLAFRRVACLMAVMSILKNVGYGIVSIGIHMPSLNSRTPVYAKAQSRTRY